MQGRLPTLSDVARRAGVSYATVDRVVNDRGGVADKSVKRVREAIDELGYVRNVAAANLSQSRTYRFAAIIPTGTNQFFQQLRAILEAERIRLLADRINLRIEGIAAFETYLRLSEAPPDAIAVERNIQHLQKLLSRLN